MAKQEENKVPFWLHLIGFVVWAIALFGINVISRLGFGIKVLLGGILIWYFMFKFAGSEYTNAFKEKKNPYKAYFIGIIIFTVGMAIFAIIIGFVTGTIDYSQFKSTPLHNDLNKSEYGGFLIYDDELISIKYPSYYIPTEPVQDDVYIVFKENVEGKRMQENVLIIILNSNGTTLDEISRYKFDNYREIEGFSILNQETTTMYGEKAIKSTYLSTFENGEYRLNLKILSLEFKVGEVYIDIEYTSEVSSFDNHLNDVNKMINSLVIK